MEADPFPTIVQPSTLLSPEAFPEMDFVDGGSPPNYPIMEDWMSTTGHTTNTIGIASTVQMVEPYTPTMPGDASFTLPSFDPEPVPSRDEDTILEMSRKLTFALEANLLCQKKEESVGDFVRRYIDECQMAHDLLESQQVSDFITSLLPGTLQEQLINIRPTTLQEVTDCARDFIHSKEAVTPTQGSIYSRKRTNSFFEEMEVEQARAKRTDKRPRRDIKKTTEHHPLARSPPNPPPLTKTPEEILLTERVSNTFRPPPAMNPRKGRKNLIRYCHFHKDHGHDTNECRELQSEIRRALNKGKLSHLVCGAKAEAIKNPDKTDIYMARKRQGQGGTPRRT